MKKVILSEEQIKYIAKKKILEEVGEPQKKGMPFSINPEKVLIVKKYLDSPTFKKNKIEILGDDGYPKVERVVTMVSQNGEPLKNMYVDQMVDLVTDKFSKMFLDDIERVKFFSNVVNAWYDGNISSQGLLKVNYL